MAKILCAAPGCTERISVPPDGPFPAYCPQHGGDSETEYWLPALDGDPRALALYQRHYSCTNFHPRNRQFMPPGEKMVLLTLQCDALFGWLKNRVERYDRQIGVCCTVFRNESIIQSSLLIREAMNIAWRKWPGERLFTYVAGEKIRSVNPGYCFKVAGWRKCGESKSGLHLLECLP